MSNPTSLNHRNGFCYWQSVMFLKEDTFFPLCYTHLPWQHSKTRKFPVKIWVWLWLLIHCSPEDWLSTRIFHWDGRQWATGTGCDSTPAFACISLLEMGLLIQQSPRSNEYHSSSLFTSKIWRVPLRIAHIHSGRGFSCYLVISVCGTIVWLFFQEDNSKYPITKSPM